METDEYPEVIYWISVKGEDIPIAYTYLSNLLFDTLTGNILTKVPNSYINKILYEHFSVKSKLVNVEEE